MAVDVARSYRWQNGMVMTVGFDGEQIVDLQGEWTDDLVAAIRVRSSSETELVGWPPDEPAVWSTYRERFR